MVEKEEIAVVAMVLKPWDQSHPVRLWTFLPHALPTVHLRGQLRNTSVFFLPTSVFRVLCGPFPRVNMTDVDSCK